MNDQKVDILLYPKGVIRPSAEAGEALAELAWILAGTGGRPRKQWATWYGSGNSAARPLNLHLQPAMGQCDPTRPLRMCNWQPRSGVIPARLAETAGPDSEHTSLARQAASSMTELASAVADTGHMVPDGTVPFALPAYLEGIGVRKGETTEAAACIVAAMCEAVHWMELTRAKETAIQHTTGRPGAAFTWAPQ